MAGKVGCGGGCRGGGGVGGRGRGICLLLRLCLGDQFRFCGKAVTRGERERVGVGTSRSRLHARSEKSGKFR